MYRFPAVLLFSMGLSACEVVDTGLLKVIGGSQVTPIQYDRQFQGVASLQLGLIHRCGATLVASDTVLTAAHCLVSFDQAYVREHLSLLFNILDFRNESKGEGKRVRISDFRVHPEYDPETLENDIAIIKLVEPVLNPPAVVNKDPSFPAEESEVVVAGWGEINNGGTRPYELRAASLRVFHQDRREYNLSPNKIFESNICAFEISTDACHGDSGGPLFSFSGGEALLVGIVSWGISCASTLPGVYTRVSSFDIKEGRNAWPLWEPK